MEVKIDFTTSAQQNADGHYKNSKKLALKKEGAEQTVKELEKRLSESLKAQQDDELEEKHAVTVRTEKQWYEKFHWFFTSDGKLAIGGRDAQQNDAINAKHFEDNDIFFHANIFGASVVVLKEGAAAGNEIREEVAQFAACYSSAWDEGLHVVDVYAMRRDQVSKSTGKGSLGTGSFLLSGEREWYRNTQLSLIMFVKDDVLNVAPAITFAKAEKVYKYVTLTQGNKKKSDAAKIISKLLEYYDLDEIIRQLPAGNFSIKTQTEQAVSD